MKRVSITEAKNNLSKLIDSLASGSSVLIVDRGRPVARLEPVTSGSPDNERLAGLVRAGIVRERAGKSARSVRTSPPPQGKCGVSALAALLDERREDR